MVDADIQSLLSILVTPSQRYVAALCLSHVTTDILIATNHVTTDIPSATSHVTTVWVMWLLCESCDYCVTTNWDLRVLWFSIAKQLDFARIWGLNPKRKFILFPKQVLPLVFLVMFPCSGGMLHLVCARDCALWTWLINPISWGMCDSFYAIMNMTVW